MRTIATLLALFSAATTCASEFATVLAPTGTLRATYIANNPVQAFIDPATQETRGPAAAISAALAKRAGVPLAIFGAAGVQGVIDSLKNGTADIGFLAFDPVRAEFVDFSQTYSLGQNTYLVTTGSAIKSVQDADRPGIRIGVGARDAGDYFLTRNLKSATLIRHEGGINDLRVKALLAGEFDAYAANRMRLHVIAQQTPGLRLTPDNFYGVEQAVVVPKGQGERLKIINAFIEEARASGLIAESIGRSGLVGVDVAPANSRTP